MKESRWTQVTEAAGRHTPPSKGPHPQCRRGPCPPAEALPGLGKEGCSGELRLGLS